MARIKAASCSTVKRRGGAPRITKGGDGGTAVPEGMRQGRSLAHDADNQLEVLVGRAIGDQAGRAWLRSQLVPNPDPCDCAHNQRDACGSAYLPQLDPDGKPRKGLEVARRRLVLRSEIGPGGLHFEDAAFLAFDRQRRLGVDLGAAHQASRVPEDLIARMRPAVGGTRLRDVLHPRTRQTVSPAELALERAASRMLRRGRSDSPNPSA